MSENVRNLAHRKLSKAEFSFLSKGLKFFPTPNTIEKSVLKEDLEKIGRKLRLIAMITGSVSVIWDKEDYLKEAKEQLPCTEMYEAVTDDPSYLINTWIGHWRNFRREVILILIP